MLIGTRAMMAYMISGTDGAISTPSALALVTRLIPRFSGKPALVRSGNSRPPSARMVTPLPPVKAVKNEQRNQRHEQGAEPRCRTGSSKEQAGQGEQRQGGQGGIYRDLIMTERH